MNIHKIAPSPPHLRVLGLGQPANCCRASLDEFARTNLVLQRRAHTPQSTVQLGLTPANWHPTNWHPARWLTGPMLTALIRQRAITQKTEVGSAKSLYAN